MNEVERAAFGRRLWEARGAAGLSQEGLAAAAGVLGITVCRLENGHHSPAAKTIWKLAAALGLTVADLCGEPSPAPPPPRPRREAVGGAEERIASLARAAESLAAVASNHVDVGAGSRERAQATLARVLERIDEELGT